MNCPKCGSDNYIAGDFAYCCKKCHCTWTQWQQERIAALEAALRRIAEHEHCEWSVDKQAEVLGDAWKEVNYRYGEDYREGHRCAAKIAKEALNEKATVPFPYSMRGGYEASPKKESK